MIYMFTLIRTGKDRKDRDKDWILCNVFIIVNTIGGIRKENGSIFSSQFLLKCSPPCWIYNKVTYIKSDYMYITVTLSQYCFFLCSQSTCFYCHIRLYRHHMIYLLSNVHHAAVKSWSWHQICDTSFFLYYCMSSV